MTDCAPFLFLPIQCIQCESVIGKKSEKRSREKMAALSLWSRPTEYNPLLNAWVRGYTLWIDKAVISKGAGAYEALSARMIGIWPRV